MASLRARLFELALPLLGIKRFFSQPDAMDLRIAKMRRQDSPRPRTKWNRKFDITEDTTRGYPVVTLVPHGGRRSGAPHILYFHGGGYVMDVAALHWDALAGLCDAIGASASVPIYPLAPEVTAATTLPAMRSLYDELAAAHGAGTIAVAGDSAGGGMALAVVQDAARDGATLPGSLMLFSPWVDARAKEAEMSVIEPSDKMLSPQGLEACAQRYSGGLALDDPRLSPLLGDLTRLPPTAIFVGTRDILLVDARRLRDRMVEAGSPPTLYREAPDMQHVYMILPVPEGRAALEEAGRFLLQQHQSGETQ